MKLPFLRAAVGKTQRTVGQWGGLDERLIIGDSSMSKMKNMSTRFYPAIATRAPRGTAQRTINNPRGLYHKNGLFWISGTRCYYKGNVVMTVTDGDKQIVGMGAYICVFPDKKIYNTKTGEVTNVDATYTQSGAIRFEELSSDSAFTKITAPGIHKSFKQYDGVKFDGVNDKAFVVDGEGATKVITEIGTDYIVVSAVIQNGWTGKARFTASGGGTRIEGTGIHDNFNANDVIKTVGCKDDALNLSGKTVTSKGTNHIVVNAPFPARSFSQSGVTTFSPYYSGSSLTRIFCEAMGSRFSEGDVVTIAGCTGGAASFNGSKVVRGAGTGYILVDGSLTTTISQVSGITIRRTAFEQTGVTVKRTSFTRTSGITIKRQSQSFDYVCEHDNRLWACSSANHEIYASKLGDPTNWNCYEGISTDSYTVTVGSDGDFTGCASHMGYVLFFKEQSISVMYGNKPSNFQLNNRQMPGVKTGCSRSLCVVNETLYYVGRDGVYQYDGAAPRKISDTILSELAEAVASQQDGKLYLSCLKGGERTLLVYDPRYQVWDEEDETRFKFAAYGDGILYYIDGEDALRTITGDEKSVIDWNIESGDLRENRLEQKWISKVMFNFWLASGSEADIYFQFDEDPLWHRAWTVHSVVNKTYNIPIVPQRCSRFRWRIEGKGQMKLLAMGVTVEGGSEINGNIRSWYRY